jgi:hypothetical protein
MRLESSGSSLAYVEDVGGTEAYQYGLVLPGEVLFGLFSLFAAGADHGSDRAGGVPHPARDRS